ncbi:type IV pilus assembly protein PilW, partial [Xanthomonas sp. Kuri4-1]
AFGTAAGARLAGTAALQVFSGSDYVASVSADSGTAFTLNSSLHDFVSGDVLVACDTNTATVFATTAVNGTQVAHPSTLSYGANAALARLGATRWYVGYNATGGTSLYRRRLYAGALRTEEVAADVSDLQLAYLLSGASSYVAAAAVGSAWSSVTAVRVTLTLGSPEKVGTDGQVLQRTLVSVIGLRNRDG